MFLGVKGSPVIVNNWELQTSAIEMKYFLPLLVNRYAQINTSIFNNLHSQATSDRNLFCSGATQSYKSYDSSGLSCFFRTLSTSEILSVNRKFNIDSIRKTLSIGVRLDDMQLHLLS